MIQTNVCIKSMTANQGTKQRILDTAERLFADQGFGNTSLRCLTSQAAVNLAAVNYHFGSKDALIEAVIARRLVPMNGERLRRLRALQGRHRGHPVPLESLVAAFIGPALELSQDTSRAGSQFIRLLGRGFVESPPQLQDRLRPMYREVIDHFKRAFAAVLPELSAEELYWRLHFLVGTLAYCMSGADMMRVVASSGMSAPLDIEVVTQRLTVFLTAGLRAREPVAEANGFKRTARA